MEKKKFKFQLPHVYTLAFILIILFALLTWIIPSGEFQRQSIETAAGTRDVAVAGSYQVVDKISEAGDLRQGIMSILMAPTRGIQAAADVVAFILLLGGTFQILARTNAMNAGIKKMITKLEGKETLIIPLLMLILGLGGSTYGMSEEVLPFYIMLMPILFAMGYDSMTTFMVCFLAPQVGYAASTTNPFNVLIAQGVAGIQGNPQLGFRFIQWAIMMTITIGYVCWYSARVKKDPKKSITYLDDIKKRETFKEEAGTESSFTLRQKLVLVVFGLGMVLIVYGLLTYGWYMDEISMVFLGMGILMGIVGGLKEIEIAEEFVIGVKDIAFAAVIVGVCRGILVVAEDGMIIDTILNNLSMALSNVSSAAFTTIMYIVQSILTILVPSSSGLAALTIPVMAPLCDLQGLNPEGSVTVLQYANQLTNMISPTAGMTVAGLAVCKITFGQWWKTIWKFFIVVTVVALVFCAISAMI